MNVAYGNMWDMEADVFCVTTNGTVMEDGRNIMGGGVALQAAERFGNPDILPRMYGSLIKKHGHHVFLFGDMVMFPTKKEIYDGADMETISKSLWELKRLQDIYRWERILLPAPGAGLGGLKWEEIAEEVSHLLIADRLDKVVTIVRYEKERVE